MIGSTWSLSDLANPSARDSLARFWLACPADQLPALIQSGFGEATQALIRQLDKNTSFTTEQISLRDSINSRLQAEGLQQPYAPQLLLAVFLYSPIGLMEIADSSTNLPAWLNQFYQQIYVQPLQKSPPAPSPHPASPDFGPFPSTLPELVGNRIHLNRILGLSNLYYIDPEDREICSELQDVRSSLADIILSAQEHTLEQVWSGDFGDRYWAMVRSGIQSEKLSPEDENRKSNVSRTLNPNTGGGFSAPGALNAFLVAMLFYEPGSMQVNNAESQLPSWLYPNYKQIFADALKSASV